MKYVRAFAATWPEAAIVQEVLARIPWYHHNTLMGRWEVLRNAFGMPDGIFRPIVRSQRTSHVLGSTDFSNQLLENGHKHFLFFVCQKVQQVAAQMV